MKKIIIFFITVSMIFSGCVNKNTKETSLVATQVGDADKINQEESKDLTLNMRTVATLNPLLNEEESVDAVLRLMYEPLIAIDDTYKPVPSIAESWYYAEEGTLLTIKIKQGLLWHGGSPITADDVIFSLNVLTGAGENAVYKSCVERVANYAKTDNYTVTVKFNQAYVGNVYAMAFPLISSAYYGNSNVSEKDNAFQPTGNSAYAFESYTAAKELKLKASENSFTKKPSIENIIIKITTDAATDVYTFGQRITDCVVADERVLGKFNMDDGSKKYAYVNNYYDFLGFNFEKEIFNDKTLRKAIAQAIPVDSVIDAVYLSNAVAASTPLNPNSWVNSSTITPYKYNLVKAREILDTAGFTDSNNDKIREKKLGEEVQNMSFSLLVNKENDERCQVAVKIAEELSSIGINVNIEKVDYATFLDRLDNKNFDMFLGGWELSIVPEFGFMLESGSDRNYAAYSSEKMDNLISAYRNSISETDIKQNMKLLQAEIVEEVPYVSIVFRKAVLYTDERIEGSIKPIQFDYYNAIENWTIN